ncbi:hypothetical protein C8F01DRAFT_1255593 [Mycena amicta]|nr:hypothetical protein C8F01DRAFT_1255593 [Mycena amicta]
MSSFAAAISHAVAFLIRPLLANSTSSSSRPGSFSTKSITTAHVVLTSAIASSAVANRGMSTYVLTPASAPAPISAASKAAGIVWEDWFAALARSAGNVKAQRVLLFFGPGYAKVRVGEGRVVDLFTSKAPLRFAAAAPKQSAPTTTQLRAALLSAQLRMRGVRTAPAQRRAHRLPSPLRFCSASASDSEDTDDSDSDYDADFTFSDSEDSLSTPSTAPSSPPLSPTFPPSASKPAVYVHPAARARRAAAAVIVVAKPTPKPKAPVFIAAPKPRTTAYIYTGGITRVMTGGVMLGAVRA